MDELDWERTAATDGGRFPLTDHTTGTEGGFFMQVLDSLQPSFIRIKMMRRSPGRTSAAQMMMMMMMMMAMMMMMLMMMMMMCRSPGRTSAAQATVPSSSHARWTARPGNKTIYILDLIYHDQAEMHELLVLHVRAHCGHHR